MSEPKQPETTVDDLITWLLEQIAEDELQAERLVEYYITEPSPSPYRDFIEPAVRRFATKETVLAECEAKRSIIALHPHARGSCYGGGPRCAGGVIDTPVGDVKACLTMRLLALPYAKLGRPGYQESWRPA